MSDPKRATLITVGAPKSVKNNVSRTVRLNINLEESNESKYPELNYKELVIVEERKKQVQNGKTTGLDPFSDNDEDVQRVARKFEQKYGGKSTYGRKGRSKHDDYADIGAGYDENDSFIDNTDGYDEIIPPECDTYLGGFYINSGSLEFKNVPVEHTPESEAHNNRRNKRRISSSSSSEESSESSSESESGEEKESAKEGPPEKVELVNGAVDQREHRKKKNKKSDKKKAKRIRRTDSSAATSGKQTSDENAHMEVESGDSRTSQSDSLASKPAPSSENAVTSDSSRDASNKASDVALPTGVAQALDSLAVATGGSGTGLGDSHADHYILKLERALQCSGADAAVYRAAWARAARALDTPRGKLVQRARALGASATAAAAATATASAAATAIVDQPPPTLINVQANSNLAPKSTNAAVTGSAGSGVQDNRSRKRDEDLEAIDVSKLSAEERETKINETIERLKALIEERKPSMIQNYKAECERVQEERKKLMIASASDGVPRLEKRLPKRRFPWCQRTRSLLLRLTKLAQEEASAAFLLARRVLPLFPEGFVRIPTLLRQAGLSREFSNVKPSEIKKHIMIAAPPAALPPPPQPQPLLPPQHAFTEPIHFPSSLTVTTSVKSSADPDDKQKYNQQINANQTAKNSSASKQESQYTNTFNSVIMTNKDNTDKQSDREDKTKSSKDLTNKTAEKSSSLKAVDKYLPPNSIGSITITPVLNNHVKSDSRHTTSHNNSLIVTSENKQKEPLIRVKSTATLLKEANEIAKKEKEKHKSSKHDKQSHAKPEEKSHDTPLYIDTSQPKELKNPDTPSPSLSKEEISQKQIENMRVTENNIPRPALVPVHHSPTFAKPARPPDAKKSKKDIVIVSDVDPLADVPQEPYAVDDSSSDVELVEDVSARTKASETTNPKTNLKVNDSRTTVVKQVGDTKTVPSHKHHAGTKNDVVNHKHHSSKHASKDKSKSTGDKGHRNNSEVSRQQSVDKVVLDDPETDIDKVMRHLREMQDSQEPNFTSNSYGGVITSAKRVHSSNSVDGQRTNKLTNFFEQHGWL